jgi:heme/copper-type cytochrome/quinol oxidase subunit 2
MGVDNDRAVQTDGAWKSYSSRRDQVHQDQLRHAGWTMFWLVAIGKLVTIIGVAFVFAHHTNPTAHGWELVVLLNWSWIVFSVIVLAGPLAYWWRLRRVRRKRAALIHAEWHVH